MKYLTDSTDLQMMCMLLQYKKGHIGKINYDTIPYIAALPDFDYAHNTLPTVVELDLYYESLSTQTLCVTVSDISKLKLLIDNGTIYGTSEAGIIRFTPTHTGLSTIRLYTTDNSNITLGRSTTSGSTTTYYSVMNLEYKTSKAGTDASLRGVRISGNVDFGSRAFFNCTQLKTVAILSSSNTTRNSNVINGCTNLETCLDCSTSTWGGFKNYILPNINYAGSSITEKGIYLGEKSSYTMIQNENVENFVIYGSYNPIPNRYIENCTKLKKLYLIFPVSAPVSSAYVVLDFYNSPVEKIYIDCPVLVYNQASPDISNIDLYVPAKLINEYKSSTWGNAKSVNALELG